MARSGHIDDLPHQVAGTLASR